MIGYWGEVPGWIIEGGADYVRDAYGLKNDEGGWSIPSGWTYGSHYLFGYGDAAAFFKWIDATHRVGLPPVVDALDDIFRDGDYSSATWVDLTGHDLESLWQQYSRRPRASSLKRSPPCSCAGGARGREEQPLDVSRAQTDDQAWVQTTDGWTRVACRTLPCERTPARFVRVSPRPRIGIHSNGELRSAAPSERVCVEARWSKGGPYEPAIAARAVPAS